MPESDLIKTVQAKYAEAAKTSSCCDSSTCCDPITSNLYDEQETAELPEQAVRASLGCGNPTALATLNQGDVVLDLGSGGGIEV